VRFNVPVLAVVGRKNSGKTTVIEGLISELTKRGFQVATVKHVSKKGFSMDTEGKDTWRHSEAGANPVIVVSDKETAIKMKRGIEKFSLEDTVKFAEANGADIVMLEGFSSVILGDKHVGKIVCLRNMDEYKEFKEKNRGEILAFCSFQTLEEPVLNIREDSAFIIEKAARFIEKRRKILEVLSQLPGLDCRKCGRATCEKLAEDIYEGRASLNECVPLKLKSRLKAKIKFDDAEVPIQLFVSEIIRKSVLGMVSTLKGVTIRGDEEILILISSSKLRD